MIEFFNLKKYFELKNIKCWESGRNVSKGWTNIQCPFCDDHSNHLGISPEMKFHCWKCGEKGVIVKLIQTLENGCSQAVANGIIEQYQIIKFEKKQTRRVITHPNECCLPSGCVGIKQSHISYLLQRGFDPDSIIEKYKITGTDTLGNFSYRIIIPIFLYNKRVCFTSRDISGKSNARYKSCPNELSVVSIKECLYNIDTVRNVAVICEGPLDVWKMGDGFIATFGTEYTMAQMKLLCDKKLLDKVFVMYDSETIALKKAKEMASVINTFVKKVEVIELDEGQDPGELTESEVLEIKKYVFC